MIKNDYYYDGHVKASGRTLEEIERDIAIVEEKSKNMTEWIDPCKQQMNKNR